MSECAPAVRGMDRDFPNGSPTACTWIWQPIRTGSVCHADSARERSGVNPVDASNEPVPPGRMGAMPQVLDANGVRAETKFQRLFEGAPDAIVVIDPDGLIHLVNQQAEALFGYSREEMIGQSIDMLVSDAPREASIRVIGRHTPPTRPFGPWAARSSRRDDARTVRNFRRRLALGVRN